MSELQTIIEQAFDERMNITPASVSSEVKQAVLDALAALNNGSARVAEKIAGEWVVHQWLKKAVLLSFRIWDNEVIDGAESKFFDKVPMKYSNYSHADFAADGVRVVPGASVRTGSYIGKNVVVMPSFVNIGAYVDEGCMVDGWATVGSCAQIGKNVHLSGGVGIGGVLEPLQAGQTGETHYGRVPAGSVVVPGNLPSKCGTYSLYAAIIVKKVDAKTRAKVGINALLRSVSEE